MAVLLALTPPDDTAFPSAISTPERYLAIAHRGAPLHEPENTIDALQKAVDLGADAVEVDLCITQDRRVVLWHDVDPSSLRAMARQIGIGPVPHDPESPPLWSEHRARVAELTLEELRANYGYDDAPETIPTLEQLADWLARTPQVDTVFLDIKDDDRVLDILVQAMDQLHRRGIERLEIYALTTASEKIPDMQQSVEDHPGAPVRIMLDGTGSLLSTARDVGVRHVSLGKRVWEPMPLFAANLEELLEARQRGEIDTVVVWTFDDASTQRHLYRLGVDGVMSNRVEQLVEVRRRMTARSAR